MPHTGLISYLAKGDDVLCHCHDIDRIVTADSERIALPHLIIVNGRSIFDFVCSSIAEAIPKVSGNNYHITIRYDRKRVVVSFIIRDGGLIVNPGNTGRLAVKHLRVRSEHACHQGNDQSSEELFHKA